MAAASVLPPIFEKLTVAEAINKVHVDTHAGLTTAEVDSRLQQYGPNAVEEEKTSPWMMFLAYFCFLDPFFSLSGGLGLKALRNLM